MKLKALINRIDKFNKELADAIKEMDGNNEFVEIGSTIIGEFTPIDPIEYQVDGDSIHIEFDGEEYTLTYKEEFDECIDRNGDFSFYDDNYLIDSIKEYRKRIRKSLKVWRSENPDAELENEEIEDEE